MPPGEEDFIDGAEDFMPCVLHKDMLSGRDPVDERFLRAGFDAVVMLGGEKQDRTGDLFRGALRQDLFGHGEGFMRPAVRRDAVVESFGGGFHRIIPGEAPRIRGTGGCEILGPGPGFHKERISFTPSESGSDAAERIGDRERDAAGLRGDHRCAENSGGKNFRILLQEEGGDGAAHGMGKDKGRSGHSREKMIADGFQIVDIILKAVYISNRRIGNAFRAPGTAVAALIIGDDGKTIVKEGKDQLGILEGIFGKAVNKDDGGKRIFRTVGDGIKRNVTFAPDCFNGFPFFQPGKNVMIHYLGVVFGFNQEIFIEQSAQKMMPPFKGSFPSAP